MNRMTRKKKNKKQSFKIKGGVNDRLPFNPFVYLLSSHRRCFNDYPLQVKYDPGYSFLFNWRSYELRCNIRKAGALSEDRQNNPDNSVLNLAPDCLHPVIL